MTKLLLACLPLLLLAACDATPPNQVLIGEWGIDPNHLEEDVVKAEQHGALAAAMAQAKAKMMTGVRATFSADGNAVLRGGTLDSEGKYVIENVAGNVVTMSMKPKNQSASKLIFTIIDNGRMTMSDAEQAWTIELIRR